MVGKMIILDKSIIEVVGGVSFEAAIKSLGIYGYSYGVCSPSFGLES